MTPSDPHNDPDPQDDVRWAAALARDPKALGAFVIAVRTTGIYCVPTCPARPLRRNVEFLPDPEAARAQGYRPCKRCHPDATLAAQNRR